MNDKVRTWKETTWQVYPRLNTPDLDPEALQYALFESNPVEVYRKALLRNRDRMRSEIAGENDSGRRQALKRAHITAMWDLLFRSTTGDKVYLLVPSRTEKDPSVTRASVISSNSPGGHRWLATKAAYRHGMPACWCIAIDTAIGKSVDVELRNENVLDPQKLYDEVVGKG